VRQIAGQWNSAYQVRMGDIRQSVDWKLIAYGRKRDRAVLVLAPYAAMVALVYLFGAGLSNPGNAGRQILIAAGAALLTLYCHDAYKPHVKGGLERELRRSYPTAGFLAVVGTIPAILLGLNGFAAFAGCVGYLLGFTYSRSNWRG
jgi:multisubunit Na+/H+ antiporter MnhB subunit